MFKKNFVRLCNEIDKPPTVVCIELGLNKATFSNWKDDSVPHARTLEKIADYFGVSVEMLLSDEKEKPTDNGELDNEILMLYNQLPPDKRKQADDYLRFLVQNSKKNEDA